MAGQPAVANSTRDHLIQRRNLPDGLARQPTWKVPVDRTFAVIEQQLA